MEPIFLRTGSHRSRDRLARALNRKPVYHYTMATGGCLVPVSADEYQRVRTIKGITRYRAPKGSGDSDVPRPCIEFGPVL